MNPSLLGKSLRRAAGLLAGAGLWLGTGCASVREGMFAQAQARPYFQPVNFRGEARLPASLHRVLLLPACAGEVMPPETAVAMDEVFATQLQRQLRFEVVRISRAECQQRFGVPEFSSTAALPRDFLAVLQREFGAEAVLFVDITTFRAYQPLALGLRAKLATVEDTRLLWAFDEVFSADVPAVSNSVRRFYGSTDTAGIPVDPSLGALQSPGKFAAYVAAATFGTLPPR